MERGAEIIDALDVAENGSPRPDVPVQDEWGFFDPARCGFAAVWARIAELHHDDAETQPVRAALPEESPAAPTRRPVTGLG